MIKKGSKVEIISINEEETGFQKLYTKDMKEEYVGTFATVVERKTSHGNVMVKTNDNQTRIFLRSDLKVIE